eukprot:m.208735 g.208735  ORF g.208735 m.208735 type:complete len:688 (+) comp24222_c0_seq1:53-2116(+)
MPKGDAAGGKKRRASKRGQKIVVNLQHCCYPIVYRCVRAKGWVIAKRGEPYDLAISDNNQAIKALVRMRSHPRTMSPVQRVNHFPNMKQLYLKNCLANNMAALQAALGPEFKAIAPPSWCVPRDMALLHEHIRRVAQQRRAANDAKKGDAHGDTRGREADQGEADVDDVTRRLPVFIVKPAGGLQGHGIRLTTDPLAHDGVLAGKSMVVQHYIDPPLLLDGFKFDLRLYVLVLSVDPLKVYVFNDGLVRLCTSRYAPPDTDKRMSNRKAHLTNYSLNKKSKNFVKGPDGSKRALKDVFATLKADGIDVDTLWTDTINVINTAVLATHPKLRRAYRSVVPKGSPLHTTASTCYEILGFDIMYDAHQRPWLIEVNHAPSFRGGSKVDGRIKAGVIQQALQMLRVSERRKRLLRGRCRREWEKYMFGQAGCKASSSPRQKRASSALARQGRPRPASTQCVSSGTTSSSPQRRQEGGDGSDTDAVDTPEVAALIALCADGEPCAEDADVDVATLAADEAELASLSTDGGSGAAASGGGDEEGPAGASASVLDDSIEDGDCDSVDGDTASQASDCDDDDREDTDTDGGGTDVETKVDRILYPAPLPGSTDTFVRIYSELSRRDRAHFADVIAAAEMSLRDDDADVNMSSDQGPPPADATLFATPAAPSSHDPEHLRRHSAPAGQPSRKADVL